MKTPCSDYEKTKGVIFFARILDKIRLKAQGLLPNDYNVGCSDPTCFDARFCRFLGLDYEKLVERTLAGGTNEEILDWCFETTRRPNEEEILFWNTFIEKRGLRDDGSKGLQAIKEAHGLGHRSDIQTWVEFHSADEGRKPLASTCLSTRLPRLDQLTVEWRGKSFSLPYFYRPGTGGPAIMFVHGLGGAKENFYAAFQSPALADCTLLAFDQPGTGLAAFDPEVGLDVSALADMAQSVADQLLPGPYFLAGASMGGLITLLQIRRHSVGRIQGLINIEGNLCPEDCMFSRRVVSHKLDSFEPVFRQMMEELRSSRCAGDQIIAHNMALNVDIRTYHAYAFETVAESDSGRLIEEFLDLTIPRLFLYGDANKSLSYLPRLRASSVQVREIASSAHFLFYDNPVETFRVVGEFIHAAHSEAAT
ncbi:MAG: alpha/beta fold hydrolase [Verrucomicrobiales bacterium]|nr:alpha/beta fold hydrolase [Verrucomicrobiales bacterium]